MNEIIANAITNSVQYDRIEHVTIEAEDIYSAMEGCLADDFVELEPGVWDVWGNDEDAGEWRLCVTVIPFQNYPPPQPSQADTRHWRMI